MIATRTFGGRKLRTLFPATKCVPKPWRELQDDFRRDFERAPDAKVCHALQIRSGIPHDEDPGEWRTLLEHHVGELGRINWYNSLPRLGANRGVQHCVFGRTNEVSLRLIAAANDLAWTDPLLSGLRTDSVSLLLYLVAWAKPHDVSYRIDQAAFLPNDLPFTFDGFDGLEAFERWENGEIELPAGRYFLWLNRDVRLCAVSAIDTLFGSATDAESHGTRLDVGPDQSGETPLGLRAGYLGLQFDDHRKTVTREGYDGEPIDFSRSRCGWGVLCDLNQARDTWLSMNVLMAKWERYGVAKRPAKGTVHDCLSELKKELVPLGLTIAVSRGVGWQIAETSFGREKALPAVTRKRKLPARRDRRAGPGRGQERT